MLEQRGEGVGQHLVRAVADEHLLGPYLMVGCQSRPQRSGLRIRIEAQHIGRLAADCFHRPGGRHDAPLLFPDITYSFYPVYCRLFGIAYEAVPLDEAMQIRVADYRRPAGALIVPNPNAPTGVALSRAEIVTLLEQHPDAPVVIDEAYVDFGAETAIPLVASHPNLLVVQTMSKSRALAGLRVGYAIGDADLIEALTRVKDSFNSYPLGRPAQAGAIASLEDEAYFQQGRARVIEGREWLNRGLIRLGCDVLPSRANF